MCSIICLRARLSSLLWLFPIICCNAFTASSNASRFANTNCSVVLPYGTQYEWRFSAGTTRRPVATNSAGTQITNITFTTSIFATDGKWEFQTTQTVVTFPTAFLVDADQYAWATGPATTTTQFFPTVYPHAQLSNFDWAAIAPSGDLGGLLFTLAPTVTSLNGIGYYRSLYPSIGPIQTCQPATPLQIFDQPPGVLNVGTLELPTFSVGTPTTSGQSSSLEANLTVTLGSTHVSLTTVALSGTSTSDEYAGATTASHSSAVGFATPSPTTRIASATAASSDQTFWPPTDHSNRPTPFQPSETAGIYINGHPLPFNSTITLGTGPTLTAIALETNSAGRTVLYGNITTTGPTSIPLLSSSITGNPTSPSVRLPSIVSSLTPTIVYTNDTSKGRSLRADIRLLALLLPVLAW
ncbi:hypothetical protein BDY17DRAFT_333990 [Neohortaea acidophila]|uniref:Uncharacterized protein n=1 Tax=Neohortaea acidophila TaxID=245834 RepID=A0A6A6PUR2_9PEZI|nr:uncharacterized protein BDY17DRAFT_333990 [Neohortaea acidophila]KAF2482977.1 hypothetical protein BDY17DRAFT_333990 [Neohortaea acidophila]